tara:strand:+ start:1399 stop:1530 length:132 start_codon:yes stop_codon:yes gene_type:complete
MTGFIFRDFLGIFRAFLRMEMVENNSLSNDTFEDSIGFDQRKK